MKQPDEKTLEGRRRAQIKIMAHWIPQRRADAAEKAKEAWRLRKAKAKAKL